MNTTQYTSLEEYPEYTTKSSSEELAEFLTQFEEFIFVKPIGNNKLRIKINTDRRGNELFTNQFLISLFQPKTSRVAMIVTLIIPDCPIEYIKEKLLYALCKLRKYHEYKTLITNFVPGHSFGKSFPGYSFDDYTIK